MGALAMASGDRDRRGRTARAAVVDRHDPQQPALLELVHTHLREGRREKAGEGARRREKASEGVGRGSGIRVIRCSCRCDRGRRSRCPG